MKLLAALTDRCCRWAVGPDYPPGQMHRQLWCGAPRATGDWFCPVHMRDAFPRARLTTAQVKARNLVTIKLALMRRRPFVMKAEHIPFPASQERFGEAAPDLAETDPSKDETPTTAGLGSGAQSASEPAGKRDITTTDTLRSVAAIDLAETLIPIPTAAPLIEWMAPSDLLVEAAYQRDLSPKSMDLIKRIAERWDWRRFKPPIVAWSERGFEIIDGQHTAIGAATRGIDKIPVLVVEATDLTDRASAFVGHNQDRLAITPVQMHRAKLAAGDEDALTAQQVIDRAGAKLVIGAYGARGWKPGETVAITTIDQLAKKRGAMHARRVVEVLVKADAAPVSAAGIKAVDMLMFRPEFAEIDIEHLPAAITSAGDVEKQAKLDAQTHCIPAWEAMGRIWFRKCRKVRKAA